MKRLLLAIVVLVSSSACMRSSMLITLHQDGSGTIDQEVGINPQALAGFATMAGGREGRGGDVGDIFSEKKAREEADKMGVKFVSGTPIDTPALKGYHAKYAFDDIKVLKVRMQNAGEMQGRADRQPFDFDFTKGATSSTITIRIPQDAQSTPLSEMGGRGGDPQQAQQMMAMMKPMLAGLYVDIALAVDGRIVKTNAPYVDGTRITLMQVDMDKLLANDAAFAKLQEANSPATLKNIPGLKITTDPTVTIEFRK